MAAQQVEDWPTPSSPRRHLAETEMARSVAAVAKRAKANGWSVIATTATGTPPRAINDWRPAEGGSDAEVVRVDLVLSGDGVTVRAAWEDGKFRCAYDNHLTQLGYRELLALL